ncbi:MAG: RNA polymerase sigma factor [Nitriliruptorales bacterium]
MALGDRYGSVLNAAREGADWAWAELYHDLSPVVLGYLRGQRSDSPEDVTSEVFLQVVRDLHRFTGDESSFRSWVFTIAHNRLIDARRKAARRPAEATPVEELDVHLAPDEAEPNAIDNVTTAELRLLFDVLSPDQRAVLLLRIVAGMTIPEIAAIVGKRVGAVKALQRRGLASLRTAMAERPYPLVGSPTLTNVT